MGDFQQIIIMRNKPSPENISTQKSLGFSRLRKEGTQHCRYDAMVKRQSLLFSNWKSIVLTLIQSPHEELLITIRKQKEAKIDEVINITYSRISKRLGKADQYYSFGVIIPSQKKYLFSCRTEEQTLALYNKIINLRNQIRSRHQLLDQTNSHKQEPQQLLYEENSVGGLLFERCESDNEAEKCFSTNAQTPKREQPQSIHIYSREMEREVERTNRVQSFCTALELEENQQAEPQFVQAPIHLQQVISNEQVECLQTDEGFKLLHNFNEGRFLAKSYQFLKANLLLATSLGPRELLQSFFHLQLWNQKVKYYSIINRIDEGIYLVKLQLHKKNFFSLPKYCYMMVNTCIVGGDYVVVFRSLNQDHFERQFGYNWIGINLWVRVKESNEEFHRLMNICGKFGNQKDFEGGLMMLEEIKKYQLFLKTTGHLPHSTLQWRQEVIEIQQI